MYYRYITILSENSEEATSAGFLEEEEDEASGLALRTLRAIRVLRPLKLVSGVPSKLTHGELFDQHHSQWTKPNTYTFLFFVLLIKIQIKPLHENYMF